MDLESLGVETGEPGRPYLARITIGTRKRRETLHEWPARSLQQAQQQADDWLEEYVARLGIGDDRIRSPQVRRERWARFESTDSLPDLPEPGEKYIRALERVSEDGEPAIQIAAPRQRPGYPTQAKVRSVITSARAAGIDVAGVRVWPDGSIAAFDHRLGGTSSEGVQGAAIEFD